MDLGEIRARIASLHKRRLESPLDAEELDELRALYEQENEARRVRRATGP